MNGIVRRMRGTAGAGVVALTATASAGCAISTQREVELGQQYASQINSELPIVRDASVNRYLNQLGDEIARAGQRPLNFTFYIVNSDVVNAFALPGGYVYVNRGLIDMTENMSELAGVLAHEIGHVEERHSVQQIQRTQGANLGLTLAYILLGRQPSMLERTAIGIGGGLYFANRSRAAENEADAVAVRLLAQSGIDPNGLPMFFQKLLANRGGSPWLSQWFSTHPTTRDRIDHVEELILELPPSLQGGTKDTQAYQAFKRTLARYPAPPDRRRR